jgi:hypothetical protein
MRAAPVETHTPPPELAHHVLRERDSLFHQPNLAFGYAVTSKGGDTVLKTP